MVASPRVVKGFAGLPRASLLALAKCPALGSETRILIAILERCTWKKAFVPRRLSASFLGQATGVGRSTCARALAKLVRAGLLEVEKPASGKRAATYRLNLDPEFILLESSSVPPYETLAESSVPPYGTHCVPPYETLDPSSVPPYEHNKEAKALRTSLKEEFEEGLGEDGLFGILHDKLWHLGMPTKEDKKGISNLLRLSDKSSTRILESIDDAIRETQAYRSLNPGKVGFPVSFAIAKASKMLSEPEPTPHAVPKFVQAPADWVPPYERSKPQ